MSSSSTLIIFLIPSILLIFSTPILATSSSTLMIKKACSTKGGLQDFKSCMQVLESQPSVVSATNFFDLSVGIIQSGISNSTNTLKHVKRLLKKKGMGPDLKFALRECKSSYGSVIGSLKSALTEIFVGYNEYLIATYDLLIAATDDIQRCRSAVSSKGIKDKIILRGNKVVPIFGLSAMEAVDSIVQ